MIGGVKKWLQCLYFLSPFTVEECLLETVREAGDAYIVAARYVLLVLATTDHALPQRIVCARAVVKPHSSRFGFKLVFGADDRLSLVRMKVRVNNKNLEIINFLQEGPD